MTQKQIIDLARIKLPPLVELFTEMNMEAQKNSPSLARLQKLLRDDRLDGFYDIGDLVDAFLKLKNFAPNTKDKEDK